MMSTTQEGRPSRLVHHRQVRGWSQAALAERCNVSRTEISAIEIGRLVPSVTVALRLAQALEVSVEQLFAPVASSAEWAWERPRPERRGWQAVVNGRQLLYPVEPTAAGMLAHDGVVGPDGTFEALQSDARPERTLVIAGCDPTVALLAREMAAQHGVRVLPLLRSSTQALSLLKRGMVHAAGIHLSGHMGADGNDRAVKASLGAGHTLVHQVCWDAGVAIASDRHERSTRALLQANLRWVNREEGSAARMAFDRLLSSRRRPDGYERVVHDHRAVAVTVASGWAEAGMCVSPAAAEFQLTFLAMQREAYEVCVATESLDDPRIAALLATLQSLRYRRLLATVPGCVAARTGESRAVA